MLSNSQINDQYLSHDFRFNFISTVFHHNRVIQNIADSRPKVRYLVAVDDAKNSLEEIVKVRATKADCRTALIKQRML